MRQSFVQFLVFVLLASVPVVFQNCSAPLEGEGNLSSTASTFPFETKVDHVAYMSCSKMNPSVVTANPNAYFTFKTAAVNPGTGVRLSRDFVYAARNLVPNDKAAALATNPESQDVHLSLGVRDSANLQGLFCDSSTCTTNFVGDFVGSLTAPNVANVLVQNITGSTTANYVADFPGVGFISDSIYTNTTESASSNIARDLRTKLGTGQAYLALTYNQTGRPVENAMPYGAAKVNGIGYRMNFALDTPTYTSGEPRLMAGLSEYDLLSGRSTGAIWDCRPEWRFKIVRFQDLGLQTGSVCNNINVEPTPTAAQIEMYLALRAVLPASTWGVDLNRRCVVQKTGADVCYGGSAATINYNGGVCDPVAGTCPHYISICKRR